MDYQVPPISRFKTLFLKWHFSNKKSSTSRLGGINLKCIYMQLNSDDVKFFCTLL